MKGKPLRSPGQSLDQEIDHLLHDRLSVYLLLPAVIWVMAGMEWFAQMRHTPRSPATYAACAALLTVIGAVRFRQIARRVRNLRLGRDGERVVGQFLDALTADGARVFHDVPGDGFNLDHIVIAPQGIFVMETKTWSKHGPQSRIQEREGVLIKNGRVVNPNPIDQVVAEIKWLARRLSESTGKALPVHGAVLIPGWFVEPMDDATRQKAWVLEPKVLPAFLAQKPIRMPARDVALAAFHLSRMIRTH